jgi:hypothetical protein
MNRIRSGSRFLVAGGFSGSTEECVDSSSTHTDRAFGSARVPPILMLTATAPLKCAGAISAACGPYSPPYVIRSPCAARRDL